MKYGLCQSSWDEEELEAINEVIKSDMFTMGKYVAEYEKENGKIEVSLDD